MQVDHDLTIFWRDKLMEARIESEEHVKGLQSSCK